MARSLHSVISSRSVVIVGTYLIACLGLSGVSHILHDRLKTENGLTQSVVVNVDDVRSTVPEKTTARIDLSFLWRPLDQLSINNTYFLTELENRGGGAKVFTNEIFRSNWNYQFTKELSLRFIAQYDETEAGTATRLQDDENLNFDVLLRYVINPWSAFYIGYNSNLSNFDIVEYEGERELIVANDLRQDGDQFFVKFSYLFQR